MKIAYPTYQRGFTRESLEECCRIAVRLVSEEGMFVKHDAFLDRVRGKPGVTIDGLRVRFDRAGVQSTLDAWIERTRGQLQTAAEAPPPKEDGDWVFATGGVSIAVIDARTDEIRPATVEDLRSGIRLATSYGDQIAGIYPVAPQDLPPLMRAVAVFKVCYESSENIFPYDYLHIRQTPFIHEMHKVMGKPFTVTLVVSQPLRIDENDVEVFLRFYDRWKQGEKINFQVLDYPMLGISKPITSTGCFAMNLTNTLAVHMLFSAFDEELTTAVGGQVGLPVDFHGTCWAWGSPRKHLYEWLRTRAMPVLCGVEAPRYAVASTLLETSSCTIDFQAGMEKMATCLTAALQGCRNFRGLGNLCVDDLYSPVQFVIDVEIVRYVRELIESFKAHPDVFATEGLYELCRDCVREDDSFLSHIDTVSKVRSVLPSEGLIRREKLQAWLAHKMELVDRAREEAIERMKGPLTFRLPEDKQRELDRIYAEAEAVLSE